MSRTRRILKGFGVGLLNQAVAAFVGLWLTRFILHRIGDHDYGLWIVAGQFVGYLSLVDIGVTALLPREVATVTGKGDSAETTDENLRAVIGRAISLALVVVPPLVVGSLALLWLMPKDWASLRGPLAISLGTLVVGYPLRVGHAVLSGLQEFAYLGWIESLSWAVNMATTVALAFLGFGLYAVAIGPAVAQVVTNIAWIARIVTHRRGAIPTHLPRPNLAENRGHLVTGFSVSLNRVAYLLLNSTDIVVIGRMLGPTAVLKYTFTDKSENLVNNQPYMIADLAGPALAEVKAGGDREHFNTMVGALSGVILVFSGGIVVTLLATNHAFVRAWIGEDHFGGMALTVLLLANMMVRHFQFSLGAALFYAGRIREVNILSLLDGALTLGLTIVLVRRIGIAGAPLASILAVFLGQTPWSLILLGRETGRSVRSTLGATVPWLVRFVPILAVAWLAGSVLGPRSVLGSALAGATVAVAYGLAMLPLLRRPPLDVYASPILSKFTALRARLFGATAS